MGLFKNFAFWATSLPDTRFGLLKIALKRNRQRSFYAMEIEKSNP